MPKSTNFLNWDNPGKAFITGASSAISNKLTGKNSVMIPVRFAPPTYPDLQEIAKLQPEGWPYLATV